MTRQNHLHLDYMTICEIFYSVEFQVQLKAIEEFLSSVPEKLFSKLRDQYLEELTQSMTQIQHRFERVQQQTEQKRVCEQMQNNGKGRGNDPIITLLSSSHIVTLGKKPLNCHDAILPQVFAK